jgi:large conductance mechanosensitive channel
VKILKEFRDFAVKGNVVDMAVGIIIGAAFGRIVSSMVNDVMMPPIGKLLGGVDFKDYYVLLSHDKGPFQTLKEAKDAGAATLNYGVFVNEVINFVIVAFAVFLLVKAVNTARRLAEREKAAAPPPAPSAEVMLLTEIRDSLRSR